MAIEFCEKFSNKKYHTLDDTSVDTENKRREYLTADGMCHRVCHEIRLAYLVNSICELLMS